MQNDETTFSHQSNSARCRLLHEAVRRSFFVYRDTGSMLHQMQGSGATRARRAQELGCQKAGTGFNFHTADVHVVLQVRGWAQIRL